MNVKQIVYNQKFHPDITILRKQNAPTENENERIAKQVIAGKWGVGEARKQALTKAGYDHSIIQGIVNEMTDNTYVSKCGFNTILFSSEVLSVLQSMQLLYPSMIFRVVFRSRFSLRLTGNPYLT